MISWQEYRTRTRNFLNRYFERPAARLLEKIGLSPNNVTLIGLILSGVTAYVISFGEFFTGSILLILGSTLDMADGALARLQNRATATGSLLDSVADRTSEAIIFMGLLLFYLESHSALEVLLIFFALTGSFMVSYMRAKGESLGVHSTVGVMTRPERVLTLAIGLLTAQLLIALTIIALLSSFTALHRFWHIRGELAKDGN